ncbi:MAG: precorrin-6Y C5,15-methyltransferase (decarboxylating) subunit CbiT [Lachnospiraceae bacterium]|nr:precorrin-6Y C5,15-methyltransferase (decarboxylating) subunit CbiT [Lachnospiraceae bacterium]
MGDLKNSDYKQKKILIFGGTIEGRQVSDYLCKQNVAHTVCVATEYGEEVLRPRRQNPAQMDHARMEVHQGQMEEHLSQTEVCQGQKEVCQGQKEVCQGQKEVYRGQMEVHQGRMDEEQIREFLRNASYVLVVDATHPYAVEVSKNICEACQKEQVPYIRYLREDSAAGVDMAETHIPGTRMAALTAVHDGGTPSDNSALCETGLADGLPTQRENRKMAVEDRSFDDCAPVYVDSAQEAAQYLEKRQGRIFLTTGSKELHVFTETISDITRLFVRVLPSAEVIASCRSLGLEGKQICAMQGPFSLDMNTAMLRQTGCTYLVTKETGASGGFPEKIEAARACHAVAVVIGRPRETGCGWKEVKARLDAAVQMAVLDGEDLDDSCDEAGCFDDTPRRISCIGIGMGTPWTLTCEAVHEIQNAQVLFGAKRMLECAYSLFGRQNCDSGEDRDCPTMVPEYSAEKIYDWLARNPRYRRVAILMSGDVGFYSGAKRIAEVFQEEEVHYFCGISSVAYFASRIPTPWQDAKLLSAHGKELPITNYVKKCPKIILLAGGARGVRELMQTLASAEIPELRVTVGSNLSYPQEQIETGEPCEFLDYQPPADGPCIMMIENPGAGQIITPGIPDDRFVRSEKIPMTKEEIRALSLAKLRLREDSLVYDVGAGTGSVSVECARLCTKGMVYAIERNQNALEVMRQNCRRFGLSNVMPVHAVAPDGLDELPLPTHAFIGGSSGNMKAIIESLLKKNPRVRIVINTVTLESMGEVTNLIGELGIVDADIVQISVAKTRQAGRYHLMNALNPVTIVAFGGEDA